MSLRKRVKGGDFVIEHVDSGNTITMLEAGGVTIDGDLTVTGNTTSVETTDTNIVDNTILLNSGETGAGVGEGTAGIEIDRGTDINGNAGIRYNESTNVWEHNDGDGLGWQLFGTGGGSTTPGGADSELQYNNGGAFGGAPITYNDTTGDITLVASGAGSVKVDQELSLQVQLTDETSTTGYAKLYAKAAGEGGTGLYLASDTVTPGEELISKSKAIVFSIIF